MINTIRITSIIAVCVAVVFLALSVFLGLKPDDAKAKFIDEIQKFGNEQLTAATGPIGDKKNAPLVVQAQAYTLKVNPPKPRETVSINAIRRAPEVRFKLVGTMFYIGMPEKSKALIDSPGKGQHWVKVNDNIEGIKIEKILDGQLVYNKNGKSLTLTASNKPGSSGQSEATTAEEEEPSAIPVISASGKRTPPVPAKNSKQEIEKAMALLKEMSNDMSGSENAQDANGINEFIKELGKDLEDANNLVNDETVESNGIEDEGAAVSSEDGSAAVDDSEAASVPEDVENTAVDETPSGETGAPANDEVKPVEAPPSIAPPAAPGRQNSPGTRPAPSIRRQRTTDSK